MPREKFHSDAKHKNGTFSLATRPETEFFGSLADGLGIGLVSVDHLGVIQYGNATFENFFGVPSYSEVQGTSLPQRIAVGGRQAFEQALAEARLHVVHGEFRIVSENGSLRTVQVSLHSYGPKEHGFIWILANEVTELVETGKALHHAKDSLQSLSARLLQAQDVERRRMARDLHDITGQELAVIVMSLSQLSNSIGSAGFDPRDSISEMTALVRKVESEVRTLSYLLHPPMLDELGLRAALSWYAEGFAKRSEIKVNLDIPPALPRLSREKEIAVFRVVQESLTNVLRHSGSPEAHISASNKNGCLRVCVKDTGRGFASHAAQTRNPQDVTMGVGILGMRERLQQLGGTLTIQSTSAGTRVVASVPLEDQAHSAEETAENIPVSMPDHDDSPQGRVSAATQQKRILIVDDHEVMRHGIRSLLATQSDLEICGEATDGVDAIAKVVQLSPDLVVLDLIMPKLGGFQASQQILKRKPKTKIVVFTNHSLSQVESMIRMMGCHGYVSKSLASADLIRAIRAVLRGNKFFGSEELQSKAKAV
jgi:PAS domain S-box-containing protein